jgi:hypothetical protein
MKLLRVVPALCALILSAVTVAGCGIGSGGAVATVDGEATESDTFDHWMAVAAKSGRRPNAQVPKPGEDEYERLREQVLRMRVSHRWLEGEAEDRGIAVSESEVDAAFERRRKERFRNDAAFEQQALDDFLAGFRRKWRARTECDEEYETQECNR